MESDGRQFNLIYSYKNYALKPGKNLNEIPGFEDAELKLK